jgi:sorting nexin-29
MIFKKGDHSECGNYRPICLLNSAYKVFAMLLLQRLLSAGADDRLWASQYGFRKARSTEHALHCARRAVDQASSTRDGIVHLLALDWAKAFDSINADSLLVALRRFGLPQKLLDVIGSIYSGRTFEVSECGNTSGKGHQRSGVCQGCPLSPFLFGILMTILMEDAYKSLPPDAKVAADAGSLYDILYADDTLLVSTCSSYVQMLASAVEQAGARYGMSLHWGKTQALTVGTETKLRRPDGTIIANDGSLVYLGGLLTGDGRVDSELSRRLGLAAGEYRKLRTLWGHASLSVQDKLLCYHSFVISKLVYGLSTLWPVKIQRRRLDGFYAIGLRRVLRIPAAFISRVSNKTIFEKAGVRPLSEQLLKRQLVLLGDVAGLPAGDPLRRNTFIGSSLTPSVAHYVRKVGRPKQNWTEEIMKAGAERSEQFEQQLKTSSKHGWSHFVQSI